MVHADRQRQPAAVPAPGAGIGRQCAALCWRLHRRAPQVLLVTSRGSGRWVPPKGWLEPDLGMAGSAAAEAWEEAGALGEIGPAPIGSYHYTKTRAPGGPVICSVELFALRVRELRDDFPERGERRLRWMPLDEAARAVAEPDLSALIAGLHPRQLHAASAPETN